MPSVTRKPQTARKQQRRETLGHQLLEATERLMGEGLTFTELSVDRLASEAGISRATFYVYFEDKGQLLRLFAQHVFADLTEAAKRWWDSADARDPEDLRVSISEIIARYRRHRSVLYAVIEMAAYDSEVDELYRGIMEGLVDAIAAIIERGQADGTITPMPVRPTASALTWMVERTCHQTLRFTSESEDDALADSMTEVIWRTLYQEAAPRP
ncbi:TetR/AcrR family transcriptional regulator [Amycolatopsis sp. NPDC004368]